MKQTGIKEMKEKDLYELFEKMDISILADISEYLYEYASPHGQINTPVGKWVFVNPMNKQWYSKEELKSTISQTKQELIEEIDNIIEIWFAVHDKTTKSFMTDDFRKFIKEKLSNK